MQKKSPKILIVDDEKDILEFLKTILEEEGYSVITADNGEYLERLPVYNLPDLILLDILLSGKDGRELVRYLKAQTETRNIPVILISALSTAKESALAAGADLFFTKPFDLAALLDTIEQIVVRK